MPKLSALSLENNKLTGMIPTQLGIKTAVQGSEFLPFARLLLVLVWVNSGGVNGARSRVSHPDVYRIKCLKIIVLLD